MAKRKQTAGKKMSANEKRARALADRLMSELRLVACEPVLTPEDAAKYGEELADHVIKFHLEIQHASGRVPIAKGPFFAARFTKDDEQYYFNLITRVWLSHLKAAAQEQLSRLSTLEATQ